MRPCSIEHKAARCPSRLTVNVKYILKNRLAHIPELLASYRLFLCRERLIVVFPLQHKISLPFVTSRHAEQRSASPGRQQKRLIALLLLIRRNLIERRFSKAETCVC